MDDSIVYHFVVILESLIFFAQRIKKKQNRLVPASKCLKYLVIFLVSDIYNLIRSPLHLVIV